ncbi:MAG: hypothetical protein ACOX2N_04440 [Peptococcia bacterium]|jgi:hypothetical protein
MKYGHRIIAADGQTVILDDRGIMQTWEVSKEDNVDANNPLVLDVYVPSSAEKIVRGRLRLRLKPFRVYSKGNSSGGGSTVTSTSGGGVSTSTASGGGASQTSREDFWYFGTGGSGGIAVTPTLNNHNHGIKDGTVLVDKDGNWIPFSASGKHAHPIDSAHTHKVDIPSHAHNFSVPSHSHSVSVPSHTHGINYGIYTSTTAAGVTIKINGTDRTSALGGPFNSGQAGLDLVPYLTQGDNVIEFSSTKLGRISVSLHIQSYWAV